MMKAYVTDRGVMVVTDQGETFLTDLEWDELFTAEDVFELLDGALADAERATAETPRAPIGSQEIWAAGVTYYRSRTARMAESERAGGGSFYDRVYTAERPEIFFKGTKTRLSGPGEPVRIRADSTWSVPEPELALAVSAQGRIFGYTIGNDVSARDIEGENPLYLPQAKTYLGSCALGPGLLLSAQPLPSDTSIRMEVHRSGRVVFEGEVPLSSMKRTTHELAEFLFRDNVFPEGCYLLTGTGIVPPDDFTLESGDEIAITIAPIGTLRNPVL